jgi:hypothetical protein
MGMQDNVNHLQNVFFCDQDIYRKSQLLQLLIEIFIWKYQARSTLE